MATASDLDTIAAEGRDLLEVVRRAPERRVPQYPTWTLLDLAGHVGAVHARTTIICRTLPREPVRTARPPEDRDRVTWAEEALAEMLMALADADPDAPCWGFGRRPSPGFWLRRMVIETGVHRWDAQSALEPPEPLLPRVAEHGLDEFDDFYMPRLGVMPPLELVAADLGRTWRFGGGGTPTSVAATGSDIYLRLMSRPGASLPQAWAEAVDALTGPAG